MKKFIMLPLILGIVACTNQQPEQSAGIYDMKAVQEYNANVASGNTVSEAQKINIAQQAVEPMKLNASDSKPKVVRQTISAPVIVPTIGVGYYRGFGHHYW